MSCTETSDLRELVDVLVEQNEKLMATIDELRTDFSELQGTHDELVASTTAHDHERTQWQQETTEKLQSLASRRRLTSALSTQRRGLSSDTCGDPSGPTLLVEGVCSCTEGLLVEGRNVTKELDELSATATTTTTTTTATTTTTPNVIGASCSDILDRYPAAKDGVYSITTGAQTVYCDMTNGGWTLLLRYGDNFQGLISMNSWHLSTEQYGNGTNASLSGWTLTQSKNSYGHINMTAFDLTDRAIKARCMHNTSTYEYVSKLLTTWSGGLYNVYGTVAGDSDSVGWMVLSASDVGWAGRGNHYMCGFKGGTWEYPGLAMCSGTGSSHYWGNHLASMTLYTTGAVIGCAGNADSNLLEWWIQ